MRYNKGQPFLDVPAESSPKGWEDKDHPPPTFSEAFLYAKVGKDDARFILGVAEEYSHVIEALGPQALNYILNIKPVLVQRLGTGKKIKKWLKDALSWDVLQYEKSYPLQVTLDRDAAYSVWEGLHSQYKQFFDPEKSMSLDNLRAYNTLTELLGQSTVEARQEERDKLPQKLERQEKRKAEIEARKQRRADVKSTVADVLVVSVHADTDLSKDADRSLLSEEIERALRGWLGTDIVSF